MRFNCDVDCIDFIFRAFAVYFARLNAAERRIRGHLAPSILRLHAFHFATDFNPVNDDLPKGCATSFAGHIADAVKEKVHHYWLVAEYYTERPIADPTEAANWKKAEKMYRMAYSSLDDAWEYQSQDTKDRWYTLAKKYVEKED